MHKTTDVRFVLATINSHLKGLHLFSCACQNGPQLFMGTVEEWHTIDMDY
jgi:hypothetical protein